MELSHFRDLVCPTEEVLGSVGDMRTDPAPATSRLPRPPFGGRWCFNGRGKLECTVRPVVGGGHVEGPEDLCKFVGGC